MSRRNLAVLIFVMIGFIGIGYVGLCRYSLPIPAQWQQIQPGQSRPDVLAQIPDLDSSLLDMKQFDQARLDFDSVIFGQVSQYLMVDYDDWHPQTAHVIGIRVRTITTRFNAFRDKSYVARKD